MPGSKAPLFEITSYDGKSVRLAELSGHGVVLNFWASWCDPCRAEASLLADAARREKDNGIVFVGLAYQDNEQNARSYLAAYAVPYASGPDVKSYWARQYAIHGVPETFFIDPSGIIRGHVIGPLITAGGLEQHLQAIR